MKRLLAALALLVSLVSSTSARAEEFTRRSFVLPKSSVELTGMPARPTMLALDITEGSHLEPFHAPLHVYFGVTDQLTLGVTHEVGPFYRWGGPCFNCGRFYNDVGLAIMYGLVKSAGFELDLNLAAPEMLSLNPFFMAARGGVLGRVNLGSVVALVFDPSLQIGITHRRDMYNRDYLWLPAWLYFQVTPSVAPFVGTGLGWRLDDFGNTNEIPLEGGCIVSVTPNVDLGGVLQFNNLFGNGGSFATRQLGFLARFRFN